MDEFKITDTKDFSEIKFEKLEKDFEKIKERDRKGKLARHEIAVLEICTGILTQARGILMMNSDMADDLDELVEGLLEQSKAIIDVFNKSFKREKDDNGCTGVKENGE